MPETKKSVMPIATVSGADKFYLAAARRDDERFAYVLALLCKINGNGRILLQASNEVYTFDNRREADAFHGAIEQMIRMGRIGATVGVFDYMAEQIAAFNAKVK